MQFLRHIRLRLSKKNSYQAYGLMNELVNLNLESASILLCELFILVTYCCF